MTETLIIPLLLLDLNTCIADGTVEIEIEVQEIVLDDWCYSSMNHTDYHTGRLGMGLISINKKKLGRYKRIEEAVENFISEREYKDVEEYVI